MSLPPDEVITPDHVAHLAAVARIGLQADELDRLTTDLSQIITHVRSVQDAAGADTAAMTGPTQLSNVMRDDRVHPSLSPEAALAMAPEIEQQRFGVPRILGED